MDAYRDDGRCVVYKKHEACRWCRRKGVDKHPILVCLNCYEKFRQKRKRKEPERVKQPKKIKQERKFRYTSTYNGTRQKGLPRKVVVYCIGETDTDLVKIGSTHCESCIPARIQILQIGNPRKLVLHALWHGRTEKEIHKKFAHFRVRGEWFVRSPQMNLFMLEGPVPVLARRERKKHDTEAVV